MHIVTRLDTDTSGLICIAKNRHIHHLLSEQIQKTGFYRNYLAFAEGHIAKDDFVIEQPIGRKDGSIIERIVCKNGQFARTDGKTIGHFEKNGSKYTLVSLELHTGRTHRSGFICNGSDIRL